MSYFFVCPQTSFPLAMQQSTGNREKCSSHPYYRPFVSFLPVVFSGGRLSESVVRWGADKSLARHTSRCRRTESIVSLERGICSCAELQVVSCYRS